MLRITAQEASEKFNARLIGDSKFAIEGVGDPRTATKHVACFVASEAYLPYVGKSQSDCWVIDSKLFESLDSNLKTRKVFLLVDQPYLFFVKLANHFFPEPSAKPAVHPLAFIHPEANVHESCQIEAFVHVAQGARVDKGVILHPHVWVGEGSSIGEDSILYSGAKVYPRCVLGKRNILHAGAVIGADGFGFLKDGEKQVKIPQVGRAVLHDDVEVGANSTIDRGAFDDTVVGAGTKIDNHVQIGHNCRIGKNGLFCAFAGISGNTIIGDNVLFAGQAGTKGHMKVGSNVSVGAQSGVSKDVPDGQNVKGYPAQPLKEYLKNQALFLKLPEIYKRLLNLEKNLGDESRGGKNG
jgi:UDP-3-O-[3-hydroxymyristoyl] glucosamine N-acyltransferase